MSVLTRAEAEDFLHKEARLIDEDKLEEWLQLFTAEGIYWIPSYDDADPEVETSIIHDDAHQLEKRIYQLRQHHLAQDPRSRTVHFITNVEVVDAGSQDEASVYCNLIVYEMRPGDHQLLQPGLAHTRAFVGRCQYRLRRENGDWRIVLKKILLIDRDLPLQNVSFIL